MKSLNPWCKAFLCVAVALTSLCSVASFVAAQSCVQLPAGLVSWWPGDGNADDIVDNNQGTLHNGATFADGMVGQAFRFDGVNSFVQAPTANLPISNSDRTLELWVNLEAVVAEEAFFAGYGAFGNFDEAYLLGARGDTTLFFSQWGDSIEGPLLQLGQWHHVAVTNIGNSVTLYLDGIAVGSKTLSINTPSGTQFFMGRIPGELGDTRRLQGRVDEVSIYNRALSATEIQAIFNADSAGKCKEPDNDGDGVPNDKDECPDSTLSATVIIDGCNAGVPNTVFPTGCTISDLIAACAEGASNHGQFVRCVAHVTNDLKKAGTITGQQKGAIQSCAAQADMP